ncbi:MAG: glycosyltransferase family 9 protein [Chloroflexi bacterium]|nr:glycosyltransferase family 9 protein [Chloroflexota bacterium]
MPLENPFTTAAARMAGIPFRLFGRRPFTPPKKALILHPCCISQVILATPLLTVLSKAYPQTQFDWAVSDWARPAISGNPQLKELIRLGEAAVHQQSWSEIRELSDRLRQEKYDTCFIPGRSGILSYIAWQARIPQRIGINIQGRGFAHTLPVRPPTAERHAAAVYLSLAAAIGINTGPFSRLPLSFYPSDGARTAVTKRLIDELDWLGDVPLVILHPGGGHGSAFEDEAKRWPVERFVRLANHLVRKHNVRLLLVGSEADRPLAADIVGLIPVAAANWTGSVSLSEIGALGEMADLYVGNDTGSTHIAAAVGCPTIAIFGPSDPTISAPYGEEDKVVVLWREIVEERPFTWQDGVSVNEVTKAADRLLQPKS